MTHHLIVGIVPAIVEIGRIEVRVHQRRGLEQPSGPDTVPPLIDETARWDVALRATELRIVREWLKKQRFAATLGVVRPRAQPPAGGEVQVGQEIDVLDIGNDGVEDGRGRLGTVEFVDDDVADEIPQRRNPAVVSIWRHEPCAAQARDPDRIARPVVRPGIEQRTSGIEISGAGGHAGDIELAVAGAVDMTGSATHASAAGGTTQDEVGVERQVAEINHVRFGTSEAFRPEHLARLVKRFLIQLGARRQYRLVAAQRERVPDAQWRAQEQEDNGRNHSSSHGPTLPKGRC
jgi:hypothetical protein